MRVIITTDLTEGAASTILPILSMFGKTDGLEIVLFHCIEPPSSGTIAIITINDILWQIAQDRIKEVEAELQELTNHQYSIETEVRLGYLVSEMKHYLKKSKSDLLILETTERRGMRKLMDPQRSLEFIGEIPISTLIIPADYPAINFQKIAVAVENDLDVSALQSASFETIKNYFDVQIKPFHVGDLEQSRTDFPMNGTFGSEFVRITHGENVEAGITQWCHQEKIDVLCMLTHPKNFLSKTFSHSVIRHMIKAGEFPILILTANL